MKRILHWRKMTWALIVWTALMGAWMIAGAASTPAPDANCVRAAGEEACRSAGQAGTAIGVGLLFVLWFFGFVVLSLVWFMTRRRKGDATA